MNIEYLFIYLTIQGFKLALIQLFVTANKKENIQRAVEFIGVAARNNAKIVSLPVISNWLFDSFKKYSYYNFNLPNRNVSTVHMVWNILKNTASQFLTVKPPRRSHRRPKSITWIYWLCSGLNLINSISVRLDLLDRRLNAWERWQQTLQHLSHIWPARKFDCQA